MPDEPLRVLYVHHTPMFGGAGASLLCLLRHLPPERVRATLLCPQGGHIDEPGAAGHADLIDMPPISPRWSFAPGRLLRMRAEIVAAASRVRDAACETGADLIHANSWPAAVAALRAHAPDTPVLWHVRDLRLRRPVVAWLRWRGARAIAISRAVEQRLLDMRWPRDRLHRVYNGIDLAEFRPTRSREETRADLGIPDAAPLVGNVGRLVPWKRHELLLDAARLILAELPRCRFVFVGGETPEHEGRLDELRALACEMGLADAALFVGRRHDVPDLINAMDVLFHGADEEPLGRVILEAMALSTPVVAANSAGPAELLGASPPSEGGGLTVTPGDATALAEGVLRMLRDADLASRCAQNARHRVETEFSAEAMAAGIVRVYHQAMGMEEP